MISDDELAAVVLARAAWSRLAEPGDLVAGAVVAALGPRDALAWLRAVAPAIEANGSGPAAGPRTGLPGLGPDVARRLGSAASRWLPRLSTLDPRRELDALARLGGVVVVPEGPGWPAGLDDLGAAAPPCLWVRGVPDLDRQLDRSVAIIGARACTSYGEHVAAELAAGMATADWSVVSGGAYGIDAVAHRAALATTGTTVAFLAGGVDRPYPAGNSRLLAAICDAGGALVSEVPPGCVPSRSRFLQRNRLIAASARGTVVVEAAWRSGALNTAGHAAALLRPVGAVPGPVTSAASAGCHRLLRDGAAVCVTDTAEVLDLVGGVGTDLAPRRDAPPAVGEDLGPEARRTLDALPLRRGAAAESVARAAGLAIGEVRAALGSLELAGLAVQEAGRWSRRVIKGGMQSGQNGMTQATEQSHPPRSG
ncbi:DNA-processing protein DprA [Cellulomonas sp. KRMCY2]|uniref:DNA-processing protein DprA n=1 Tax=Cellulomonas sp. KRMCY2 TaxID=1304865 RepID=UPI00045EB2FE|nr:DNA-processing protein DprA [Cellulomonas sp. KRMCY2]